MKWFEGSINDAVATSKLRKAIFVVFVEGKDEASNQVAGAIDTLEVSSRLEQEDFVAIRLESGTEPYRFFAQIYHLVPVPSLFFIGENGIPLEIVAGSATATDLASKIDSVLAKGGKNSKSSSLDLIQAEQKVTAENAKASATNLDTDKTVQNEPKAETESVSKEPVLSETVADNNVKIETPSKSDINEPSTSSQNIETTKNNNETNETSNSNELTPEEKIERAKQLIEAQRRQRVEEEEKKERERELERRRMGRDVQKLRQKQQDIEAKQAHEERMKEKAAEAAAREKVRQQIAQDKLERKQKELAMQQQNQQNQVQEQCKPPPAPVSGDETVTRIQFRLPSGNPHMGRFEPNTTLRALRDYVQANIDLPFRQFVMSTSFPRRELSTEDDDKTLLELELVPTAVILILPLKNGNTTTSVTSSQDVGFFSRFMWSFFTPLIGIYNYLVGYFSGGRGGSNTDRQSGESRDTTASSDDRTPSHFQNVAQSSGVFRRNLNIRSGTTIKTEGNVRRLHSGGDDNDENNTWNGNSTQQM